MRISMSLFIIFCFWVGIFITIPFFANAQGKIDRVVVSATVLEHLTYINDADSVSVTTNVGSKISLKNQNIDFFEKSVLKKSDKSSDFFIITLEY